LIRTKENMLKSNVGLLRKLVVIFPALFWALSIAGCGQEGKESKRVTTEIENIRIELEKEIVKSSEILSELHDCSNQISKLENIRSLKEIEKSKSRYDLGKYVLNHKTIIQDLIAVGIGTAEALEENLDKNIQASLQGPGKQEIVYCIFHLHEYAEVAARIAWYEDKLNETNDEISTIENRIYEMKQKQGLLKQKYDEYEESIQALQARLQEKQER
jgi:septal ring factor EnvC (AmiA/AmiB activator)